MRLVTPDPEKACYIAWLAGFPLVICALLGAGHGLPTGDSTLPALLLGTAIGLGLAPSSASGETPPDAPRPWWPSCLLALLAGSSPLWLPASSGFANTVSATLGVPLAGPLIVGGVAAALSALLGSRLAGSRLPGLRWCALAVAIGLIPATNVVLPAIGLVRLGLLGGLLLLPLALWPGERERARPADAGSHGFAVGVLLTAAPGLLLLAASPLFGPGPSWFAEAFVGLGLGLFVVTLVRSRRPALADALAALAPLALVGAGELLLRGPHLVGTLLARGVPPLVGGSPLAPALLTVAALLAVGLVADRFGPRTPAGMATGLALWLILPPLLGPDVAIRVVAAALALLVFPAAVSAGERWRRGLVACSAVAALACLALPQVPSGARAVAPYASLTDPAALGRIHQVASWRQADVRVSARGSVYVLDDLAPPVYWSAGRSLRLDRERVGADAFLAHLPGLLRGDAPTSVLVLGVSHGGVLDSLRRSSAGLVRVREPSPARSWLVRARGGWNGEVAADPAVRFQAVDPTARQPGQERFDAVLFDLPPPWVPGGPFAWSDARVRGVARTTAPGGVAVFRIPLDGLSGDELAGFALRVCRAFPDVTAWLDPSGASHLVLAGRPEAGPVDAGAVYRAWSRRTVADQLRGAALFGPADVLDRLVTNRDGLLAMAEGLSPRDPHGTAVVAGARVRAGRRALPLAALAATRSRADELFDLSSVPTEERTELAGRLERAAGSRADYLELLAALTRGDSIEAMEVADRIASGSGDSTKDLRTLISPWLGRCRQFRAQGLLEQARSECLIAVSFSPADPEANLLLGDVQRLLGDYESAGRTYQGVRDRDPTSLGAALGLAAVHEREGRVAEAAELLEEAEKLHPGNAVLLNNLGSIYLRMANTTPVDSEAAAFAARARTLFQAAAALEPRMAEPRAGLAEVYSATNELEKALLEVDRAVALEPGCSWRPLRAEILYLMGRTVEAEAEVDGILFDCPDDVTALGTKGLLLNAKGCHAQAKGQWDRVLQLDPENPAARSNLRLLDESGLLERGDRDCRP